MTARIIIEYPNALLRRKSIKVVNFDSGLQQLINDLIDTMLQQDSMGIAAPQIGISQQVFVINTQRILGKKERNRNNIQSNIQNNIICFVNPKITKKELPSNSSEGCLSTPGKRGTVKRFRQIQLRAWDKRGFPFCLAANGMLSTVIQHEIDHLHGILFIDKLVKKELVITN
ncbi:MAG: peptide deformylase [Mastigocoleus sp.]